MHVGRGYTAISFMTTKFKCCPDISSSDLNYRLSRPNFVHIANNPQVCMSLQAVITTTMKVIRDATLAKWPIHMFSARLIVMIAAASSPTIK